MFRKIVLVNGTVLLLFGLIFAVVVPIEWYGLASPAPGSQEPNDWAGYSFARFLGVACIGYGALLLATSRAAEIWVPQTVAGALFVANLAGFVLLLGTQLAVWESFAGWVTVAVHLFFTVAYGFSWFTGSLADVPLDARPSSRIDREL